MRRLRNRKTSRIVRGLERGPSGIESEGMGCMEEKDGHVR